MVDAGVGLADADGAGVDDGVEQSVVIQLLLPDRAELPGVVGHQRGAVAPPAQVGDPLEDLGAELERRHVLEDLPQVEPPAAAVPLLGRPPAELGEGQLAALDLVPGMVAVLVAADEQRRQLVGLGPAVGGDGREHRLHRLGQHAPVVEEHRLHGRRAGTR